MMPLSTKKKIPNNGIKNTTAPSSPSANEVIVAVTTVNLNAVPGLMVGEYHGG